MRLNMNIYHQDYVVGDYIKLIQFYQQTSEYERTFLSSDDLLHLISRRKINCRFIKVKKLMIQIRDKIEHDHLTCGYIGVVEQACLMKMAIGHNQYPTYRRELKDKFKWTLYWLNLAAHGKVIEEVYEEYERVLDLIRHRYVPARLRAAIEPLGGVADKKKISATRWD